MRRSRLPLQLLLALALALLAAAPAAAGGFVQVDGPVLRYTGDALEPNNVTIAYSGGDLRLVELGSRITAGPGCVVDAEGYRARCPSDGIERLEVITSPMGSDVRNRTGLPSLIKGGPGDDVLIGGWGEDAIYGDGGDDVLAGGDGADVLHGGPGTDLVTYADQIGSDGALHARRRGVRVAIGRPDWSGSSEDDRRDTIADDVEQVEGTAAGDRFFLRDGQQTAVTCGGGRDGVSADPRDAVGFDCESTTVAPERGGARIGVPTLQFPFTVHADRGRSDVRIAPVVPLQGGALTLRVACPPGTGLLALVGPGCNGRVYVSRGGAYRIRVRAGSSTLLRLRLRSGAVTVTAVPDWGIVRRTLRFVVRG